MKHLSLIIIISFSITIFGSISNEKYGIVKLNSGLPSEVEKQIKNYAEPFYASIPSNNAFNKVYVLWDKSKPKNYLLVVIFKNNNKSIVGTSFQKNIGDILSDSSSFQNSDEFKSRVPYQIHLNPKTLEMEYYWSKSKENGITEQGGFPQFIKPRLCKGKMMPEFNFNTFDGETISSEKLKGKFVFIDFWGTWCGGCIYEMPNIKTMREKISTDKLFIVGFVNDEADSLKKYMSKNTFNYPNVLVDQDFLKKCEVQSYPTTLLIDPKGEILSTDFWGDKMWENVFDIISKYGK